MTTRAERRAAWNAGTLEVSDAELHELFDEPASVRAYRERRPAVAARGMVSASSWNLEHLGRALGGACLSCGAPSDLAWDHVVPLALNGPHGLENLQRLCRPCNSRKGAVTREYRTSRLEMFYAILPKPNRRGLESWKFRLEWLSDFFLTVDWCERTGEPFPDLRAGERLLRNLFGTEYRV
jgi:hypothetical protein